MTIAVNQTITAKQYVANAVATQFAFPNKIFAASDLVVTLIDSVGNQYAFVNFANIALGMSYTVQGVDVDTGCTVVFASPPGAASPTWTLDIRTVTPEQQTTSIKNQGSFFPELHEEAFDRATRELQDVFRLTYTYGIHGPDIESAPWPALPVAAARKGLGLVFDAATGLPAVGVLTAQIITTGLLAPFLGLSQTTSESVAGVTPVNLAYPPGDVRRYGAVGDGATDSTQALINAFAALAPGSSIVFEQGATYLVTPNGSHTIFVNGKSNFHVRGNNAVIKAANSSPCAANDELFYFVNCSDGTVENLTVDGNRANRTPVVTTDHNIVVTTSCLRLTFRKVRSVNSCMDGWVIQTGTESVQASYPTDIVLEECRGSNSYRNGLSIVATLRCTVRGGRYHDSTGTAPQNGIDIEPNSTTTYGNTDTLIDGVDVSNNVGIGVQLTVSGGALLNFRPRIFNLSGTGNNGALIKASSAQDLEVDGVLCGPHSVATRGLIDLASGGSLINVSLRNLVFASQLGLTSSNYCIYDQAAVSGRLVIDGVKIYNVACKAIQTGSDASVQNVTIQACTADPAITVAGGVSDYKNISVDTQTGRGFYASVPVDVDGMLLVDCSSTTTGSAHFDTGSVGCVVRNVTVRQRTAIPGGAVGIYFHDAPRLVENVLAVSAGTDYTAANIFNFFGGTAGATVTGCAPNPFSASATVNPGSITNGTTFTQVIAIAGIAFGDFVQAAPGVDLGALTYSVGVSSAGNIRLQISNDTASPNNPGSSTWKFLVEKRA